MYKTALVTQQDLRPFAGCYVCFFSHLDTGLQDADIPLVCMLVDNILLTESLGCRGFCRRLTACTFSRTGFQDADMIPAMMVVMGNFSAAATSNAADADYVGLREGFTQLARLIDTYSTIKVRL